MSQSLPFVYRLQKIVENFDDLTTDSSLIYCIPCNRRFAFRARRDCERHVNSPRHRSVTGRVTNDEFLYDLCIMFCACHISWRVINNADFRRFFTKYIPDCPLPRSDTMRQKYLPRAYEKVVSNIREDIRNQFLWLTVDETTDFRCNKIVNVILRILSVQKVSPPILIASKRVLETTAETVELVVTHALSAMNVQNNNVLMLVTDAAVHMVKAGNLLKNTYPNMTHVTCLAHALHRVAEEIRKQYPVVDSLIANTKNIFIKASSRKQEFKKMFPNVPLPPQPVRTQWCTWIQAVVYCATNFENLKTFILQLDPRASLATRQSQWACQQPNIHPDLCDIVEHFEILVSATTKLESAYLHFSEALSVISNVETTLAQLTDSKSRAVHNKLKNILEKNRGYKTVCTIWENGFHDVSVPAQVNYLQFAPLTSVDVERSFSLYKHMYRPNRSNLSAQNAEQILVVNIYSKALPDLRLSK